MTLRKEEAQEALARSLSGLQEDPRLAQRIIASEKGEMKMKKLPGAVLVLAVILGITMATALAAGVAGIWRSVNWFGEEVPNEDEITPSSTMVPPAETTAADIDQLVHESINRAEARELVVIATENSVSYAARVQAVSSMEEFTVLMEMAPGFPLPKQIPDGYTFSSGSIEFGCLSGGEYTLTCQKAVGDGVTESHYAVDEAYDCILGYTLRFTDENRQDSMIVSAHMQPSDNSNDDIIGIADNQTAEAIRIDGMDNSIAIDSDTIHLLFMRKIIAEPISTLVFGSSENWVETYGEYHTRISSGTLSTNDLASIFSR